MDYEKKLMEFQELVSSELLQGAPLSPNFEFSIEVVKSLIKDAVKIGVSWKADMCKLNRCY